MGKPRLPDVNTLIGLGFDPASIDRLLKYIGAGSDVLCLDRVDAIKKILRKNDREQYVNRFEWLLPGDLTGELVERMLYYRYSIMFFYIPELNEFKALPYAGKGIDEYGRYKECTPLPFNGSSEKDEVYIPGLSRIPIYDMTKTDGYAIPIFDENGAVVGSRTIDPITEGCVIINAYCRDLSNRPITEQAMMDPLLDMMAEAIPLARTNLIANAGTKGMRVSNPDEYSNVEAANKSIEKAALTGKRFIPIVGTTDFQEFSEGGKASGEEFFLYMQTLDNLRLQSYGLKNNGLFEKNQYINNTMAGNIQANVGQIYEDALKCRQDSVDLINAIWGPIVAVNASETVTNSDTNMDGETLDDNNGSEVAPDESGTSEQGGSEND